MGNRLLLGRSQCWPDGNVIPRLPVLSNPAGNTRGAAVRAREFWKKTGIMISDARYPRRQPWPCPTISLMLGYLATGAKNDRITLE